MNVEKEVNVKHIIDLIEKNGGNKVVSEKTLIPVKTLESWKSGDRTPPEYVIRYITMCFSCKQTTLYPLFKGQVVHMCCIEPFKGQEDGNWWKQCTCHSVKITRDVTIKVQVQR